MHPFRTDIPDVICKFQTMICSKRVLSWERSILNICLCFLFSKMVIIHLAVSFVSTVSSLKFAIDNAKLKVLQENALEEPFLFLTHLIIIENIKLPKTALNNTQRWWWSIHQSNDIYILSLINWRLMSLSHSILIPGPTLKIILSI